MDALNFINQQMLERNRISRTFFASESLRLAQACHAMSERFLNGGRLLAFGQGAYATDAQHVSVEFVHPVIVGKRALPALDLSFAFEAMLECLVQPEDIVMGFAAPTGDQAVQAALEKARLRGAMTFALPGLEADYAVASPSSDPFIHQELIEILYHTLWETVHVFLEHGSTGEDVGAASFLYPFLGGAKQDTNALIGEVSESIIAKALEDEELREIVVARDSSQMLAAAVAIRQRLELGGKIITLGNGGSATDANDLMLDCVSPPNGLTPIPAISLSLEPANITAIANDVGTELIFVRQLIAQAKTQDVVVAISTSGGSRNLILALEEARKRKLLTVALLGRDGGEVMARELADFAFIVPSEHIPRVQEIQAFIYHVLRELIL